MVVTEAMVWSVQYWLIIGFAFNTRSLTRSPTFSLRQFAHKNNRLVILRHSSTSGYQ